MAIQEVPQVLLQETRKPATGAVNALVESIRALFGESLVGVLFYGSCRREVDPQEGLVDLYAIVDSLRPSCSLANAALGWLLPPNVRYLEVSWEGKTVRCKYAVVSLPRFRHGIEQRFHPYFWARFAQPTSIVWSRDEDARTALTRALASAPRRLLAELTATSAEDDPLAVWRYGFRCTYRTELRVESGDRADMLVDANRDFYLSLSEALIDAGDRPVGRNRVAQALRWQLRIMQGKVISVLRLLKGAYTFEGGADYVAWKLERHTGRRVEVPDRVRRWPLIFVWPLLWRLYRDGVLR